MASYSNIHLRVISGHELPKTDLFSQIDPYVTVTFMGESLGRTATRDNSPNPVWNEDFFFEAEEDEEGLHGVVVLDLYDEEVTKDEYVGSIRLDLQELSPDMLMEPLELPIKFKSDKRGQKLQRAAPRARLTMQVMAIGKGFSSYASELAESEVAVLDERSRTVLIPVPDTDEEVWTGLRFGSRCTHLLLLSTADPKAAANPAMWYDLSYSSAPSLRLERVQYRKPVKMCGLKVWVEVRATNVPLGAKLSKVRILEREHRLVDTLDPADALVAHNYMIGMPFLAAVKEMSKRAVHVDTAAQSIWVKMDANQPQPAQLLQLDYGAGAAIAAGAAAADAAAAVAAGGGEPSPRSKRGGGGGNKGAAGGAKFPALRVCSTNSDLNRGYELAFFGGGGRGGAGPMVTISEAFRRPQPVMGGMYDVVHTVELVDAFVGDVLEEVGLGCYELMKPSRTWRLAKLLEAAAHGGLWEGDEGAYGDGGNDRDLKSDNRQRTRLKDIGMGDVFRSMFSWCPCVMPPREEAYLEGGRGEEETGRAKQKRGGHVAAAAAEGKIRKRSGRRRGLRRAGGAARNGTAVAGPATRRPGARGAAP